MGSGKGEGPSFSGDCYDEYVRKLKTMIGAAEVKAIQQQRGADQLRSMQGVVDRSDEAKQRIVGRVKQRHGALVAERAAHAYGMDNNDFGGIPG